jgi:hypothetical protein
VFQFLGLDYIPNPPRGCSYFYCYDSVNKFVEENQLKGIVRGHECKEDVGCLILPVIYFGFSMMLHI